MILVLHHQHLLYEYNVDTSSSLEKILQNTPQKQLLHCNGSFLYHSIKVSTIDPLSSFVYDGMIQIYYEEDPHLSLLTVQFENHDYPFYVQPDCILQEVLDMFIKSMKLEYPLTCSYQNQPLNPYTPYSSLHSDNVFLSTSLNPYRSIDIQCNEICLSNVNNKYIYTTIQLPITGKQLRARITNDMNLLSVKHVLLLYNGCILHDYHVINSTVESHLDIFVLLVDHPLCDSFDLVQFNTKKFFSESFDSSCAPLWNNLFVNQLQFLYLNFEFITTQSFDSLLSLLDQSSLDSLLAITISDKVHTLQCVSTFDLSSPTIHQFFILTLPFSELSTDHLNRLTTTLTAHKPQQLAALYLDLEEDHMTHKWRYIKFLQSFYTQESTTIHVDVELEKKDPGMTLSKVFISSLFQSST